MPVDCFRCAKHLWPASWTMSTKHYLNLLAPCPDASHVQDIGVLFYLWIKEEQCWLSRPGNASFSLIDLSYLAQKSAESFLNAHSFWINQSCHLKASQNITLWIPAQSILVFTNSKVFQNGTLKYFSRCFFPCDMTAAPPPTGLSTGQLLLRWIWQRNAFNPMRWSVWCNTFNRFTPSSWIMPKWSHVFEHIERGEEGC